MSLKKLTTEWRKYVRWAIKMWIKFYWIVLPPLNVSLTHPSTRCWRSCVADELTVIKRITFKRSSWECVRKIFHLHMLLKRDTQSRREVRINGILKIYSSHRYSREISVPLLFSTVLKSTKLNGLHEVHVGKIYRKHFNDDNALARKFH